MARAVQEQCWYPLIVSSLDAKNETTLRVVLPDNSLSRGFWKCGASRIGSELIRMIMIHPFRDGFGCLLFSVDVDGPALSKARYLQPKFKPKTGVVRGVFEYVLGILNRYQIPTTWAWSEDFLLDSCDGYHEEILRPPKSLCWQEGAWFREDLGGNVLRDSSAFEYIDYVFKIHVAENSTLPRRRRLLKPLMSLRWRHRAFHFPIEWKVIRSLSRATRQFREIGI